MDDTSEVRPPYNQVRLMQWKQDSTNMEERTVEGWASTPEKDSYGDIVTPEAFTSSLQKYMQNPVMYWNHDWQGIPIAKCLEARIQPGQGLWVKTQFGSTQLAEEVWTAVAKDKTVRSMSIGFRADYSPEYGYYDKNDEAWIWTNLDLKEISIVGMPACASAQFQLSKSQGLPIIRSYKALELDIDTSERAWDSTEVETRIRNWSKTENAKLGCYLLGSQLPIVDIVDGTAKLAWNGVACAMVKLLGGRGGLDVSDESRKSAMVILEQAYRKCGKALPSWKGEWPTALRDVTFNSGELDFLEESVLIENARTCSNAAQSILNGSKHWAKCDRGLSDEMVEWTARSIGDLSSSLIAKEGKVLSERNMKLVSDAIEALQAVLNAAGESSEKTYNIVWER